MKRNYNANDRMLWHKSLDGYFRMDTFCTTKAKSMKSIRQSTCCQLFVTDKGYIYFCTLKKESDVTLAMKLFAKEIVVPEALIIDGSKAKTSAKVKIFCIHIGTTIKILE